MGITALRLARFGCRNRPHYRIVAIDSRKARDAAPIEYIGTYNPIPSPVDGVKEVRLRVDRIKYWLSCGAQPSDRVSYLLWRAGLMPAPPLRFEPTASINKDVRREAAKAAKKFHTMTNALAAAAGTGIGVARPLPAVSTAVLPGMAAFSGMFVRPSAALLCGAAPGCHVALR